MEASMVEADFSGKYLGASGAIMVAAFLPKCQALVKFNISANDIRAGEVKALADALKGNQIMKELNLAKNSLIYKVGTRSGETDLDGVRAIANAIPTMGALYSVNIGGNRVPHKQAQEIDKLIRCNRLRPVMQDSEKSLSELDLSSRFLDHKDASVVAQYVENNGALTFVNILSNDIGAQQANKLIALMASKPNLKTLCGFSGDETELDLSGKRLTPGCGVLVANEVKNNGALTILNMSNNNLFDDDGAPAGKALSGMLAANNTLKALDVSSNAKYGSASKGGPSFAKELAAGLGANGAMTKFDISNNSLCAAGGKALAEALKGNSAMKDLNLAGNRMGMKSIYGSDGADMSGVIAISDAIPAMGALTSLNISANDIGGYTHWSNGGELVATPEGPKAIADALKVNVSVSSFLSQANVADILVAKGALASLDLSQNRIPAKEMGPIERLCESKQIALRK